LESTLISWIGRTDLKASRGDLGLGFGPIAQAAFATRYVEVHLLSDFEDLESQEFCKWLAGKTGATVKLHSVKLSSPINFSEIYQGVISVLEGIRKKESQLTYHLSPGTPAMQSVWILLAKTTHPAKLIQSSQESGVQEANIPFDIAAEFIPQLLKQSDEVLTQISQGAVIDTPEFSDIVHRSPIMKKVIAHSRRVALRSIPVLIEGESGTGKELLARAIHKASPRADKPFVSVNCGAIPSELVESDFFGHKKGAFTGAIADRKGYFESAHLGTLFLDEVGELPLYMQVKLLRSLQEGEVVPVGSVESRKVNVRVIAATNRTLIDEVSAGRFREDLFYRLAVAIIRLPPLRDRAGDLTLLIDKLFSRVNEEGREANFESKKLSVAANNIMLQHNWPGNVRELLNTLQRASVWSDENLIGADAMREAILAGPKLGKNGGDVLNRPIDNGVPLEELMGTVASHYIKRAMAHTNSNKTRAAELLGIGSYQTLTNWIERYEVRF
jgi:transcriptional regulator with PAS, ATPase and Fis domain